MSINALKKTVGPVIKKIKKQQQPLPSESLRPLAELLIRWYERKLAEEEAKKYDK